MKKWLKNDQNVSTNDTFETVSSGMKKLYKSKLKPVEEAYHFHNFHSPALTNADFDAAPMVLLVGQYSVGKTTFVRYLLEQDFPGMRIGPEPTTDCFIALMGVGKDIDEGVLPGNALVIDQTKPFSALSSYGNAFLQRFQCGMLNNEVLQKITIIDTPGILSGEKQRINRGYDFSKVNFNFKTIFIYAVKFLYNIFV